MFAQVGRLSPDRTWRFVESFWRASLADRAGPWVLAFFDDAVGEDLRVGEESLPVQHGGARDVLRLETLKPVGAARLAAW